jgi:4-amino-4-deoxy-L-arabinose transferase-like glycosyltransferase
MSEESDANPVTDVVAPAGAATRPSAIHISVLALLALALNLYGIDWGLPNGIYDWSNDSVAPLEPLAYAKRMLFREPWTSTYPPFHFMVLALAYAPYVAYLYLTGGLAKPTEHYPYGLANPELSLMTLTLIARLVSVAMGVGLVVVTYVTVKRLYGARSGLIAGLLVATSYPVIHYAHNANVDVPQLFWTSLALYSFVGLIQTYQRKYYILLGTFAALAVGTKDSIYALFVGLAAVVLAFHARHLQRSRPAAGWFTAAANRHLLYGLAAFVLGLVLVFNLPWNWQGFEDHVRLHLRRSVVGSPVIRTSASPVDGELALMASYARFLCEANVAPLFLLLIGGLGYGLVRSPAIAWSAVVVTATYYALFLRLQGAHAVRYVLPLYLLLVWPAAKLAGDAMGQGRLQRGLVTAALALVFGYGVLQGVSVGTLYARDPRYAVEAWMRHELPPGTKILGVAPRYTLPRFPSEAQVTHRGIGFYGDRDQVTEIGDVDPDYIVIGMSTPQRRQRPEVVERFFRERGYRQYLEFTTPVPFFGREVRDLHSINPRIVVFARARPDGANAATPAGGAAAPAGDGPVTPSAPASPARAEHRAPKSGR